MGWLPWLALVFCFLAAALAGLSAYGSRRWTQASRGLARGLETARIDGKSRLATRFDSGELEGLPAPVQRYFRAVLKEGQPIISAVSIEMTGTINLSATTEQWKPFRSKQRVVIRRPGFLWDARVSMLPGIEARVVDSYIAGTGLLRAAVFGLFTVADASGGGEIGRGEFMRFFAEAPWYPTALLPSQGVTWKAADNRSAYATLVDGSQALTLLFRFNDAGLIDSVRAEARGGLFDNKVVMMPWECNLSGYEARDGMTIPLSGSAAWVRPEGRKPYFHGAITALRYEFASHE
jgi:hypothetical protein